MYQGTTYDKYLHIVLFVLCLVLIFGYIIYSTYIDYQKYKSQEGMDKITRKITKTANTVKKNTKKIAKSASSIKNILNILKCPVNIFSNISTCGGYYYRDKLFELIWLVIYIINFVLIYIPVFILDKIICFLFKKCFNISPNDVCLSKKSFFKFVENIYYLMSGGDRYLHRNSSDIKKCYCAPPLVLLFDPLRKFTSYFERLVKSSPNYVALLFPIVILIILAIRQK